MKPIIITLILITQILPLQAQANWREQPKWFGIGLTIGIATGDNAQLQTVAVQAALAKTIWDINSQKGVIDPFTAGYGAFMGSTARIELKKRKANRVTKKRGKRITKRQCWWSAY